jgi:hypothetical protein
MTIGIDLGDIWSHYCTHNEDGEVVDRGRFRTNPFGVDKRFRDLGPPRVAMEAGTHSIWLSEQIHYALSSLQIFEEYSAEAARATLQTSCGRVASRITSGAFPLCVQPTG